MYVIILILWLDAGKWSLLMSPYCDISTDANLDMSIAQWAMVMIDIPCATA